MSGLTTVGPNKRIHKIGRMRVVLGVALEPQNPQTAIHTERGRLWQAPCGDTWRYWSSSGPCAAAKELLVLRVKGTQIKAKDGKSAMAGSDQAASSEFELEFRSKALRAPRSTTRILSGFTD